ncbi:MAG: hypothetical protein U5L72_01565 [Bacteroidales bacterium]|nr:hypothetical protein [Bacteroidales bacterium]
MSVPVPRNIFALKGDVTITIDNTIRNSSGRTSLESCRLWTCTTTLPGIKAIGEGVIAPALTGTIFPFRARVKPVDLSIVKIETDP